MKRLLEDQEAKVVMDVAAKTSPARLRPSAFAIVADLLLADGKIDPPERRFLQRLAASFGIDTRIAGQAIDVMLVNNRL
jgi:hypothetical protein